MQSVRITVAVATVLRIFIDEVARPRHGYELMQLTGFPSGKLYPILARLERAGWLTKEQELVDPAVAGRPIRRLYRLSEAGIRGASYELAVLREQLREPAAQPSLLAPESDRA
jgi:PadR family transcriptional regulator PadR